MRGWNQKTQQPQYELIIITGKKLIKILFSTVGGAILNHHMGK